MPGTGRLRLTRATLITALNRDTPFHRTTGVHERRRRSCPTKSSRSATDASELDAMAEAGGTSFSTHVVAGDEASLSDAFNGVVDDIKLCTE